MLTPIVSSTVLALSPFPQVPCKPGDTGESDGKDEAICPCDMNVIIDNDLRTIFQVRNVIVRSV